MDNEEALKVIDSMMWVKKASIFLLLLDYALRNLDSASDTQKNVRRQLISVGDGCLIEGSVLMN
ncbi:hypothetical protein QLG25_27960 [Pseudomonas sp. CBR-F]